MSLKRSCAPTTTSSDPGTSPLKRIADDWVSSLSTSDRQTPQHTWTTSAGCLGTNDNPCPHTWKSTDAGRPPLKYDPSVLPTGVDTLDVKALDPLGNTSTTGSVPVKVDHMAPSVNLTGTMTEQATRGPSRPRYILKVDATDGSEANPQSGVVSVKISVDGKQVQLVQPGCATQRPRSHWLSKPSPPRFGVFRKSAFWVPPWYQRRLRETDRTALSRCLSRHESP